MNWFQSIILGVIQGLTEFLPVSSTGHLIIVNQFVSFREGFTHKFDVIIQLGAILSVIIYFRKELLEIVRACAQHLPSSPPSALQSLYRFQILLQQL